MPRKQGRLTKNQLAAEADTQLRDNARDVLSKFWDGVKRNLDAGDRKTMEMVGRMFQYDKGPGGVTIFNQHLQVNSAAGGSEQTARVRSFDQIVGKLEDRDKVQRQLAAPMENSEADEFEDDEESEEILEAEEINPAEAVV